MHALCLLGDPTFVSLFFRTSSFLPQSPEVLPAGFFLLPCPLPHTPSPWALPTATLLQLPCQPVSFSLMLQANRVGRSGQRRPRGTKTLEQSEHIVGLGLAWHCPSALTPSLGGYNPGHGGSRQEASVPFLMERATLTKGTQL